MTGGTLFDIGNFKYYLDKVTPMQLSKRILGRLVSGCAVLAMVESAAQGDELVYKGKTLSEWVLELKSIDRRASFEAAKIFHELGPKAEKAIPELMELLTEKQDKFALLFQSRASSTLAKIGPKAVPRLLQGLQSNDSLARAGSARALGLMIPAVADQAPALRKLLKDDVIEVRIEAASALAKMECEDREVIALLIDGLKHEQVRWDAAGALGDCGSAAKTAVPALMGMLNDPDYLVRRRAAQSLGNIGPDAAPAVPLLVAMLELDAEDFVRISAAEALGDIGPGAKAAIVSLRKLAVDEKTNLRGHAIWGLAKIDPKDPNTRALFMRALTDEEPYTRSSAAYGLSRIGPGAKQAVAALVTACDDTEADVRQMAVLAVVLVADVKQAGPVLRKAIKDADDQVRLTAIFALGKLRPVVPENVTVLIDLLEDRDVNTRGFVYYSLAEMGPSAKDAVTQLTRATTDSDIRIRIASASALWNITGTNKITLPVLLPLVESKDKIARTHAICAVGKMGPEAKEAIGALTRGLKDSDDKVRINAAWALCRIGGPKEAPMTVLLDAVKKQEDRLLAITLLSELGPDAKTAIPALMTLAQHRSLDVRNAAHEALRKIDQKSGK